MAITIKLTTILSTKITIFLKENQMLRLNKKSYFVKLNAVKVKYVHTGIKYMYL